MVASEINPMMVIPCAHLIRSYPVYITSRPAIGILMRHSYVFLKLKTNLLRRFQNFSSSMMAQCSRAPPYGKPIRFFLEASVFPQGLVWKRRPMFNDLYLLHNCTLPIWWTASVLLFLYATILQLWIWVRSQSLCYSLGKNFTNMLINLIGC